MRTHSKKGLPACLRPQDVLVVCKLCVLGERDLGVRDIAESIGLSPSEIYNALSRSKAAGLIYEKDRQVKLAHRRIASLLIHGVPSVFYAERGPISRGMPTAAFAPPLADKLTLAAEDIPIVWATAEGRSRGETLVPIYPTAPAAAAVDAGLYELLVLIDGIRVGRARERKLAVEMIEKRLIPTNDKESPS